MIAPCMARSWPDRGLIRICPILQTVGCLGSSPSGAFEQVLFNEVRQVTCRRPLRCSREIHICPAGDDAMLSDEEQPTILPLSVALRIGSAQWHEIIARRRPDIPPMRKWDYAGYRAISGLG